MDHKSNSKPAKMQIIGQNIPFDLTSKNQFVAWHWQKKENGEWTKPLFNPTTGKSASTTKPETWVDFGMAKLAVDQAGWDGLGYVFYQDGLTGIDFDDCRDKQTGKIKDEVLTEIKLLNSYSEVSPSGTGIKTICRASLPASGHHNNSHGVFDSGRYFCLTGNIIPQVSTRIEKRQAEVEAFVKKHWPKDFEKETPPQRELRFDDSGILEKIRNSKQADKFNCLWSGDTSGYSSHSEADQALCNILAFWTNKDRNQIDKLFRQSGLYRKERWDKYDYAKRTIDKALSVSTETYQNETGKRETGRNLTEDFKLWIESAYGTFTTTQVYSDLDVKNATDKTLIRVNLHRAVERGEIERGIFNGTFRKIDREANIILIQDTVSAPLPLRWPGEIEQYAKIMRKSTVGIAGTMQAGKTAYLLNCAWMNKDLMPTYYFTSEFGADELTERLQGFNYPFDQWRKITFIEKSRDFQDVVNPDGLNLIDYLEVSDEGEFFKMGIQIKRIYEKLNTGVAVIGLQKKFGSDFGYGGQPTADKPRLYISLEKGVLKVVKAKLWATKENPDGMTRRFKLVGGARFVWESWVKP